MAWRQIAFPNGRSLLSATSNSIPGFAQFSTKSNPYPVKVGIPEFLNGIGKGVEQYTEMLESEFGDLNKLLVARGLKLKKLGVGGNKDTGDKACRHRKLILKFAHKYRLGLWRPRAVPVNAK